LARKWGEGYQKGPCTPLGLQVCREKGPLLRKKLPGGDCRNLNTRGCKERAVDGHGAGNFSKKKKEGKQVGNCTAKFGNFGGCQVLESKKKTLGKVAQKSWPTLNQLGERTEGETSGCCRLRSSSWGGGRPRGLGLLMRKFKSN